MCYRDTVFGIGSTETKVGRRLARLSIKLQVIIGAPEQINLGTGPSVFRLHNRQTPISSKLPTNNKKVPCPQLLVLMHCPIGRNLLK